MSTRTSELREALVTQRREQIARQFEVNKQIRRQSVGTDPGREYASRVDELPRRHN